MASATIDRLRHAVAVHAGVARPPLRVSVDTLPPIERVLRGDWHEMPQGPVFVRDEWYPLDYAHGIAELGAPLAADREALAALLSAESAPHPERHAFFDIETTGLSGGTGTYVIVAGIGTFERAARGEPLAFRLRQYFLAGLQHEPAMLAMLAGDLARSEAVVTYNGRAFDIPCVESRLTLARIPSPCRDLAHFDLLHSVRRLYGHRLPGCRLAEVERHLLRIDRPGDIPGHLIPALYRDYVVAGRAAPLRGVLSHNADDVLSLVGILAALARLLSTDDHNPDDAVSAARWWERAGQHDRAMSLYRHALPWLEGADDWDCAASRHALLCKRAGSREEAAPLWRSLWARGDRRAGLELAKNAEHQLRDLDGAADIVQSLLRGAEGAERDELSHRLARINHKRERRREKAGATHDGTKPPPRAPSAW
jgi:uncharacterized protein YprB with RNaseH-like and TPR domain